MGELPSKPIDVAGMLRIGRDNSCDVILKDSRVSRIHGLLTVRDGCLYYRDCGSTNLTFVNGRAVSEAELGNGDLLCIGGVVELKVFRARDSANVEFVQNNPIVTEKVRTGEITGDYLAVKLAELIERHKRDEHEETEHGPGDAPKMSRLLAGMKTLYQLTREGSQLVPVPELLDRMGRVLLDSFPQAETLAILLKDPADGRLLPRHVMSRPGYEANMPVTISRTVLAQAIEQRSTIAASDARKDERFADSDSLPGLPVKSFLCAPLVSGEVIVGALYLENRTHHARYNTLDAELATTFASQCSVSIENARMVDRLQEHYSETLQAFINIIEAKDAYTSGHSQRVADIAVGIARAMKIPEDRVQRVRLAAQLHDIGKLVVTDDLLNKTGSLSDTEFSSMKGHVDAGESILKPITYLSDILPWISGHHERWDGSGYPKGLEGEQCPVEGRILGVADTFDAMTTQRSYNQPLSIPSAIEELRSLAGRKFDPRVIQSLCDFLDTRFSELEAERDTGTADLRTARLSIHK